MELRPAILSDVPVLKTLIAASIQQLGLSHYTPQQIEAALQTSFFGIDTELLADQSYFVIEDGARAAACGGWSRRKTLFGGDGARERDSGYLDPSQHPAKIRAFFVHPNYARRGLGTRLLSHCEEEAKKYQVCSFEMLSTFSGVAFYEARGYAIQGEKQSYDLLEGVTIDGVRMVKQIM